MKSKCGVAVVHELCGEEEHGSDGDRLGQAHGLAGNGPLAVIRPDKVFGGVGQERGKLGHARSKRDEPMEEIGPWDFEKRNEFPKKETN